MPAIIFLKQLHASDHVDIDQHLFARFPFIASLIKRRDQQKFLPTMDVLIDLL